LENLKFDSAEMYNLEVLKTLAAIRASSQLQKCQNLSDADLKEAFSNIGPWFDSDLIMCIYEEMRRRRFM